MFAVVLSPPPLVVRINSMDLAETCKMLMVQDRTDAQRGPFAK